MSDASIRPKLKQPFLLDDPDRVLRLRRLRRAAGLVAIGAASVLAASVVIYLAVRHWQEDRAYVQIMRNDLGRLIEAEHVHYQETGTFADLDGLGSHFVPSQAVWIDVHVEGATWRAAARHERVGGECWVEGGVRGESVVECG